MRGSTPLGSKKNAAAIPSHNQFLAFKKDSFVYSFAFFKLLTIKGRDVHKEYVYDTQKDGDRWWREVFVWLHTPRLHPS